MNRIDKVVVFRPLGSSQLQRILDLELNILQQRIFSSANSMPFVFHLTGDAKACLLREGTDLQYGARHLKRAIDRSLVHPLSSLIASDQIRGGDLIHVDYDADLACLSFVRQAENMPAQAMLQMAETRLPAGSAAASVHAGVIQGAPARRLARP
jgi:ATP-dependent Clp protease ATP-binding subunit ClpA